jgi:hypothetical protein
LNQAFYYSNQRRPAIVVSLHSTIAISYIYSVPSSFSIFIVLAMTKGRVVYFIRHGEKPAQGKGLNAQGVERSKWLRKLFGPSNDYGVKHMIAQRPKTDGKRRRPYDTLQPLADELGLTVDIDCERDNFKGFVAKIKSYKGEGNVLVCWEHKRLTDLAAALGVHNPPIYPKDRFDIIWTCEEPYHAILESNQECPGLDV